MSEAYEIFDKNYSFDNTDQGKKDDISKWSLMCWREAFKWGYDYRDKEVEKLEQQLKESKAEIEVLYSGKLGACHTCEQVAELNIKLEQQLTEANEVIEYYRLR